MGQFYAQYGSLRIDPATRRRLCWAIFLAVFVHAALYGGYLGVHRAGWGRVVANWAPFRVLDQVLDRVFSVLPAEEHQLPQVQTPVVFIEVPPILQSDVAPKQAKYYSDRAALAGSPKPAPVDDQPRIDGKQSEVPQLVDVKTVSRPVDQLASRPPVETPKPQPLQPPQAATPTPQQVGVNEVAVADGIAIAQRGPTAATPSQPAARTTQHAQTQASRPRTLQEALASAGAPALVGEKMNQPGAGSRRQSLEASIDVVASPFGTYDKLLIQAVRDRWYYLLDSGSFSYERKGKVVIQFKLHYDGRVTDLEVLENTVNELLCLLCQKAILDPAPYAQWPPELRRLAASDYRIIRFTFYYH